ncbi:MAG: surface-adhesin E family protein [Pseudomonadota bacterium]
MKKLMLAIGLIAAASAVTATAATKESKPAKPTAATAVASASAAASQAAPSEPARDWRVINSDKNAEMSLDAASIREIGKMREVWAMWNFKTARENKGDPTFPALKSYQDMYVLNCEDKTMRLTREIIYAENFGMGDKRDHSDALTNMAYEKPVPDSVAETMVNQVCAYKIPKK